MSDRTTLLTGEQLHALMGAYHENPFSVLGMHSHPSAKGLVVRALLPGAQAVTVVDSRNNSDVGTLHSIHSDGLFEGVLAEQASVFPYYLKAEYKTEYGDDSVIDIQDPYRFPPLLDDDSLHLFCEGTQEQAYRWMGAHPRCVDGVDGVLFVLWAPSAKRVSVVGDFNAWDGRTHVMRKHPAAGVWEIFVPCLPAGTHYKYEILSQDGTLMPLRSDPYASQMQAPPLTASVVDGQRDYQWGDGNWMASRNDANHNSNNNYSGPVSIYEVHLGSWRRQDGNNYLDYRQLAEQLIPYALDMGFTHLQLMPVSEYPFDGSWGYQPVGMFAPTSRFGTPDDFRYFVDRCHQSGLGVLLDWVPGHFPTDAHGLGQLDGSHLYEHADPRKGFHPDWNTLIYNYGRSEVQSFLISNAIYWLDEFHIDGLRVDAVASMLYLDYSREDGQWIPNEYGGRENLEAVELLQQVNSRVYFNYPGAMMVAEESTAWPGVSKPVNEGGLGFGFKWNMGWMNDTLTHMARDPIHRKYHHNEMSFGLVYAFDENFVLPLSHDEVVHGKGSLLSKMPGDAWQQFANLRVYYGFMWTHPGKKLLFMGGEFAQWNEWNHDQSLDWHLLDGEPHQGVQRLVRDLNKLYREVPAMHQLDCQPEGFEWLKAGDNPESVFAYLRKGFDGSNPALVIVNLTPSLHQDYRVGVPSGGFYQELLNTDSGDYGGSNQGNGGGVQAVQEPWDGQACHLSLTIPPLATLVLQCR
ncbi:1,4-alpha-glucan branching protein GlgB [Porticoccus sp. GXU_MW_L64]